MQTNFENQKNLKLFFCQFQIHPKIVRLRSLLLHFIKPQLTAIQFVDVFISQLLVNIIKILRFCYTIITPEFHYLLSWLSENFIKIYEKNILS